MLTRIRSLARLHDEAGVSLIELLVVMVLLGVVGTMVTSAVVSGLAASSRGQARVEALTELETAVHRVTREVRAAAPIHVADVHTMEVTALRGNGRIRWTFAADSAAATLTAAQVAYADRLTTTPSSSVPARPLVRDLVQVQPTFTYAKADGSAWVPGTDADRDEIHRVTITLRRDLAEQDPIEVETSVHVRSAG